MPLDLDRTPGGRVTMMRRIRYVGFAALLLAGVTVATLTAALLWWEGPLFYKVFLSVMTVWALVLGGHAFGRLWGVSKNMIERLQGLVVIDEASGSFDALYLRLRLDEEEERTKRYGGVTSILCLDVAGLKEVTARGPEIEKAVLGALAGALASGLRQCDVVGRAEENEFLAILPETDRRDARLVAERLRCAAEDFSYECPDGARVDFIRASVGIAALPINGATMGGVVTAARRAAKDAEQEGGNTLVVSERFVRVDEAGRHMIEEIRGEKRERA